MHFTVDPPLQVTRGTFWRTVKVAAPPGSDAFGQLAAAKLTRLGPQAVDIVEQVSWPTTTVGNLGDPFDAANLVAVPIPVEAQGTTVPFRVTATCQNIASACDVRYLVWAYDITLDDPVPPRSAGLGGTMVSDTGDFATASLSGVQTAVVLGTDEGAGLYRAVVQIDGRDVAEAPISHAGERCVPSTAADGRRAFLLRQPCPSSGGASITWDTTQVADGTHRGAILLEDAAGNRSALLTGTLKVRNSATTGPGSPIEFRGAANGSNPDDHAVLSLSWPQTAKAPAKSRKVVRRCRQSPAWAARHPARCVGRPASSTLSTDWSRNTAKVLAGTLVDSAGAPISGAAVQITVTPLVPAAKPTALATVVTDAAGSFTTSATVADGARSIGAQWQARQADNVPAASTTATLNVRARATFHVPASIKAGGTARLSGTIPSAGLMKDGRTVAVQWLHNGWRTIDAPRTNAQGSWHTKLHLLAKQRIKLRVLVDQVPTYPFLPGTSATRTLTVR